MALNAFLSLKGQVQGEIKGSVTQKGRENKILVIAASHDIISPRDPASGQASGKVQHKPFVITKELDRSSPLLYQMLVTNEKITDWKLQFWAANRTARTGAGTERQHYSVTLKSASITGINFRMLNTKDPELSRFAEYEEISFSYESITWTWEDGGITAQDDW